jgi:hypothetical protein
MSTDRAIAPAPSARRIFVFGGSNSLITDGWVPRFQKMVEGEFDIINRSIGAATTLMGIFRLSETADLGPGDIAIWEYGVNDHSYINRKSHALLVENFTWFLQEASARGAHVFAVLMYGRQLALRYALGEAPLYYTARVRRILKDHQIPNIDLADELFKRIGTGPAAEARVGEFYQDTMHYNRKTNFLNEVAALVRDRLRSAAFHGPAKPLHFPELKGRKLRIFRVCPDGEGTAFKNSLISGHYASIGQDILIGRPSYLKALIVLTTATGGSLVLPDTSERGGVRAYSLRAHERAWLSKWLVGHIVPEFVNWPRRLLVGPVLKTRRAMASEKIFPGRQYRQPLSPDGQGDGILALILEECTAALARFERRRMLIGYLTLPWRILGRLARKLGLRR